MSPPSPKELVHRFVTAYNAFDVDGMVALLSDDVRFENYSGGQLTAATCGIAEFRQIAERAKLLFAEREQRITGLEFGTDSAIAAIAYRGRLAVDIPDGPTAGTVLELRGESEYSFGQGKITRLVDRS